MNTRREGDRQRGAAIILMALALTLVLGVVVTYFLVNNQTQMRATRYQLNSIRALYDGYGRLERAKYVIGQSAYTFEGRNLAIQQALTRTTKKIQNTDVVLERLTGDDGTWYKMTATVPYEDTQRVLSRLVREVDFFSSYNLFVADDPAGISGRPVGSIHTNKEVQFYFPNGFYRDSVTAVQGHSFQADATAGNTTLAGPFNDSAERIDIDFQGTDAYNLDYIGRHAEADFNFDDSVDIELDFFVKNGEQWVDIERFSQPSVETVIEDVVVGYKEVNPREEEYTYTEKVSAGFETRTRDVQVFERYDTAMVEVRVPVYMEDERQIQIPVYRREDATREVKIYRSEDRTRTVVKKVWMSIDDGSSGGTTVGGDSSTNGFWAEAPVEETYQVKVFDHYETETYQKKVLDHYETEDDDYMRLDHYDTVQEPRDVAVYRTETEEYQVELFDLVDKTATKTVYDYEPIHEQQTRTVYHSSKELTDVDMKVPDNGLIFADGDVKSVKGEVIGRVTVASRGEVKITDDLVYVDGEGDHAFLNGETPWLPYEPNPDYDNRATLGLIANNDVIYSRYVDDNFEVNASMMSVTGRVGIEGIELDENGVVEDYNQFVDEFGRPRKGKFAKNSIRRLGGVTTSRRPVETVVKDGKIRSGFNVGAAVYDYALIENPPPYYLRFNVPRFFSTSVGF